MRRHSRRNAKTRMPDSGPPPYDVWRRYDLLRTGLFRAMSVDEADLWDFQIQSVTLQRPPQTNPAKHNSITSFAQTPWLCCRDKSCGSDYQ